MGAVTLRNCEGLTFKEWYAAATAFGKHPNLTHATARKEWRAGVDPTEWAAALHVNPEKKSKESPCG